MSCRARMRTLRSLLQRGSALRRKIGSRRQLLSNRLARLPGLVLIRQRPGSAKGVVFLTIEDEHGAANLVVFEQTARRDRAALASGRLLGAEGRVEREVEHAEVPITHLIVRRLVDRSDLLNRLVEIDGGQASPDWTDRPLARADGVGRPEPGSPRPKLPGSRDFR